MTPRQQRFCPLCERAFADGEAVLRCEGCGVMHHPACWVKNGGCATKTEHKSVPVALAYSTERLGGNAALHPGEGTRVAAVGDASEGTSPQPIELRPGRGTTAEEPPQDEEAEDEPEIIGAETVPAHHTLPFPPSLSGKTVRKRPSASRAYRADHTGKPMPSVYGRHRILQLWYVPAAILLAAGVALGVIWVAGQFDGDDSNDAGGAGPTTTPAATPATPPSTSAGGAPTAVVTASVTAGVAGKFQPNDQVVVTGVGSGSGSEAPCLNVRTEPGTDKTIIDCLAAGTQITILGGPQEAGGLKWWKVKLPSGDGWAAEDYLARR